MGHLLQCVGYVLQTRASFETSGYGLGVMAEEAGDAERANLTQVRRMALARRIRELRAGRDWSQATVCRKAGGLDRSYYSELESGLHSPSIDTLWQIASAFEVHITELLRD